MRANCLAAQARSAAKPIPTRSSQLKADAQEFQPSSGSRGASPSGRPLSAGAQPFQPLSSQSSLGQDSRSSRPILKADAPTFQPKHSAAVQNGLATSRSSSASLSPANSFTDLKQQQVPPSHHYQNPFNFFWGLTVLHSGSNPLLQQLCIRSSMIDFSRDVWEMCGSGALFCPAALQGKNWRFVRLEIECEANCMAVICETTLSIDPL